MIPPLPKDHDGEIGFDELQKVVDEMNQEEEESARSSADAGNGSGGGAFRYSEGGADHGVSHRPPLDARAIWALLDQDRSGTISINEFAESARAAAVYFSASPAPFRGE